MNIGKKQLFSPAGNTLFWYKLVKNDCNLIFCPDPTRVLSCFDEEVTIMFMNSYRFLNILQIEVFLFYLYFSGRYINNTNGKWRKTDMDRHG